MREECLKTASAMTSLSSARMSMGMVGNKMKMFARAQAEEECEVDCCMDLQEDCNEMSSNEQCFKVD